MGIGVRWWYVLLHHGKDITIIWNPTCGVSVSNGGDTLFGSVSYVAYKLPDPSISPHSDEGLCSLKFPSVYIQASTNYLPCTVTSHRFHTLLPFTASNCAGSPHAPCHWCSIYTADGVAVQYLLMFSRFRLFDNIIDFVYTSYISMQDLRTESKEFLHESTQISNFKISAQIFNLLFLYKSIFINKNGTKNWL